MMTEYERPDLEEHLETTIPPIGHVHTEYFFERVTDITLGEIRPEAGKLVLDAASGMGIDACILAERGFTVLAMEPMQRMAGYSRFHHDKEGQCSHHLLGYAEEMPIRSDSIDQVLCKGSLDHFLDPRAALSEMRRVTKPGGRIVVALANYDSLSCYLSKMVTWVQMRFGRIEESGDFRPPHEPPPDHHTVFNSALTKSMVGDYFVIRKEIGIGALWGVPYINEYFDRLAPLTARMVLSKIHALGEWMPSIADMTVVVGEKP